MSRKKRKKQSPAIVSLQTVSIMPILIRAMCLSRSRRSPVRRLNPVKLLPRRAAKRPRQSRALIVVAPVLGRSAAKDQAVGGTASLVFVVSTPRYGFAVFIYTCPLFLHTSAVVNHAGSVPGVQGAAVRNCSIASGCWRRECRAALSADCGRQD